MNQAAIAIARLLVTKNGKSPNYCAVSDIFRSSAIGCLLETDDFDHTIAVQVDHHSAYLAIAWLNFYGYVVTYHDQQFAMSRDEAVAMIHKMMGQGQNG